MKSVRKRKDLRKTEKKCIFAPHEKDIIFIIINCNTQHINKLQQYRKIAEEYRL